MRVLVLGGSHFVGRALVEAALDAGHDVAALNRGMTGHTTAGATHIRVDRTDHDQLASALGDDHWDSVIDTWSGAPVHATAAARLLGPRTSHYGYVSSRSVYTWPIQVGVDESHPVVDGEPEDSQFDNYPRTKRGSELGILGERPDALIARPGLIIGPHEDVGRLPWWLQRLESGGRVLAPGPPARPLQYIDARDLAEWMLRCADQGVGDTFNAVSESGHCTMGELLDAAIRATGSTAELVWLSPEDIEAAGIEPWTELPIWLPPTGELAGLHDGDVSAAIAAGLRCRPIIETVNDTWSWMVSEGAPEQRDDRPAHGLDPIREAEVVERFLYD